jgi:hypothetical protein
MHRNDVRAIKYANMLDALGGTRMSNMTSAMELPMNCSIAERLSLYRDERGK